MATTPIQFHTNSEYIEKTKYHDNGDQEVYHIYDCPFCSKENHFYYFPATTTWDCKVCGKKGNVHIFNQLMYNDVCTRSIDDIIRLWKLPRKYFETAKYNPLTGNCILPTFRNNKLNNLYKVVEFEGGKTKVFGTPGLPSTMMNWFDDSYDEVWLCEGQKDKIAADAMIGNHDVTAISLPGANTFKESWAAALQGKKVVLCFDNDKAGAEGKNNVLNKLVKSVHKPKEIYEVQWPSDHKTGYDLHDHYMEHKGSSWRELNLMMEEIHLEAAVKISTETIIEDMSCDSYDKAVDAFAQSYFLTDDMKATLAMVMASIYSIKVNSEQLWVKVIGPPGCGKSSIAKAISASDYVVSMSTFTGLFSGWSDGDEKDPSLVPIIEGRTLVVKDADALLRQKNIEKIMSELRDFYDKDSSVRYNNRKAYDYQNIRSTFIMMGTQVLRRADQSFLGERLVTVEMDLNDKEEDAIKHMAIKNGMRQALEPNYNPENSIMSSIKGWIEHLRDRDIDTTIPQEFQDMIMRLCSLCAVMRTQVDRDWKGRLQSPAVVEVPSRLIKQMLTATISLSVVFGVNIPTEEVYKIIVKVLRDTINPRSHRYLLCDHIIESPGITARDLIDATGLHKDVIALEVADMLEINALKIVEKDGSRPGYKVKGFMLKDEIATPLKEISL